MRCSQSSDSIMCTAGVKTRNARQEDEAADLDCWNDIGVHRKQSGKMFGFWKQIPNESKERRQKCSHNTADDDPGLLDQLSGFPKSMTKISISAQNCLDSEPDEW